MTQEYLNSIKNTCTKKVYRAVCKKKARFSTLETNALMRIRTINEALGHYNEENLGFGPECKALRKAYKRLNRQMLFTIRYTERAYRYKKDLEKVFPVEY